MAVAWGLGQHTVGMLVLQKGLMQQLPDVFEPWLLFTGAAYGVYS